MQTIQKKKSRTLYFPWFMKVNSKSEELKVKCLSAKQKTNKCTLSLSLKNTRAGSKFTNSADPKGADHPQKLPSNHEIYENRAVEKNEQTSIMCAFFKLPKGKQTTLAEMSLECYNYTNCHSLVVTSVYLHTKRTAPTRYIYRWV